MSGRAEVITNTGAIIQKIHVLVTRIGIKHEDRQIKRF